MSEHEREVLPPTDYLRPIIADGDTGHGGLTAVMKLTKLFIEKGAAGIHFEDQKVCFGQDVGIAGRNADLDEGSLPGMS